MDFNDFPLTKFLYSLDTGDYPSSAKKYTNPDSTFSRLFFSYEKKKKTIVVTELGLSYFTFDSKWYTEVCNNNDFNVSGHFRLQHYGDGSRRLIYINEFVKHGYHRKALIDKVKDGELSIE